MPTQAELRPLAPDQVNAGLINRPIYLLRGDAPGWVALLGFDGVISNLDGTVYSTLNPVLHIKAGAVVAAILVEASTGAQVLLVNDSGVVMASLLITGDLTVNGNLIWKSGTAFTVTLDHAASANRVITVPDATDTLALLARSQTFTGTETFSSAAPIILTGTAVRITGPFENATRGNRPFFQSSATNGDTNVSVLPSGSNTISKFEAYNNATPGSATGIASLEANNTEIRLTAAAASGGGLPLQIYVGSAVLAVNVDTAGDVTMPASVYASFTPGITQNGAQTVSGATGRYHLFGKECHMQVRAVCTNAGLAGNIITLTGIPAGVAPLVTGINVVQGQFQVVRAGVGIRNGAAYFATTTTLAGVADADTNALGTAGGGNFALANGDVVSADMQFEIA